MRNAENIRQLEESGIADWMGMIFYPKSSRYISEIPSFLPKRTRRIGVFVNPSLEAIEGRLKSYGLGGIQLHGQETPDFIKMLKVMIRAENQEISTLDTFTAAFNALPECSASTTKEERPVDSHHTPLIIKVFSIASEADLEWVKDYEGLCDYFLFDTKCPTSGGSGKQFDWSLLQSYKGKTPFLLSGGIGPESIPQLAGFHHPMWRGIDLNSRFETAPALKDIALLTSFCKEFKALYHE